MHPEILSDQQKSLIPMLSQFSNFYLVGGTSIALRLGHRQSIDFDLFTNQKLDIDQIRNSVLASQTKCTTFE